MRLVEILYGVLRNYGDAYEVGFDMTNMSMMMGAGGGMSAMDMGSGGGMSSMSSMDMGSRGGGNMSTGETKIGMQVGAPTKTGRLCLLSLSINTQYLCFAAYILFHITTTGYNFFILKDKRS